MIEDSSKTAHSTKRAKHHKKAKSPRRAARKVAIDKKKALLFCTILLAIVVLALSVTVLYSPQPSNKIAPPPSPTANNMAALLELELRRSIAPAPMPNAPPVPAIDSAVSDTIIEETIKDAMEELLHEKLSLLPYGNKARISIVLDDAGENIDRLKCYTELSLPLSIAVLPLLRDTKECASLIVASGKELLLHQPMQALNPVIPPGEGAIYPDTKAAKLEAILEANFASLGEEAKGFNNHEGSLVTSNEKLMRPILAYAKKHSLYFLDSRTTKDSVSSTIAQTIGAKVYERNGPFLDNIVQEEDIIEELCKGVQVACDKGHCILIGHVDKSYKLLPKIVQRAYPILEAKGYTFSFLSEIYATSIED